MGIPSPPLTLFRVMLPKAWKVALSWERCRDSWPLEERNSIWGQWWGLIVQSFCIIKFYKNIKAIIKASDIAEGSRKSAPWLVLSWMLYSYSVQFSYSVVSDCLWPHGLQYTRLPCLSPATGAYSNSCPLSQWCHPTISSHPLLSPCPPAFNLSQNQGLFK